MRTKSLFTVIVMMFALGNWTEGVSGGNGKGGGGGKPGGDGDGVCSVDDNWSTVFSFDDAYSHPDTRALGMEMAAIDVSPVGDGSDILVVATAHVGIDGDANHKSIEVFSFSSGTLTHIQSVPYPADFKAYQELLLDNIDGDIDGSVDLLLGSRGVNQVVFYSDIAGTATAIPIEAPTEGDTFGTSFGEGLAFGDFVSSNPGNEIAIGADNYFDREGRVFIYSAADLYFLGALSSPELAGSDRFGSDLAMDPSGGLYVSAKWAAVDKKREAGKVFPFLDGLSCEDTDPTSGITLICESAGTEPVVPYTRGNRNEELGKHIAVTSEGDLAATAGDGLAYFTTPTSHFDLPMPGTKLIQHLAAADINFDGGGDDLLSGRPNNDPDAGSCWNTGSAFVYLDPAPNQSPITLRSPDVIDANNLFFGWGAAAASGTVFVSERGRDIDADGNPEGVIYAFTVGP